MDVAFAHFTDLKEKVPHVSISMTCKFTLMTYLTERQDYKEAKELASELIEEVDLNSSSELLQNFASAASEHSPEIAKKVIELCLKHPEITDEQKDVLRTKLKELQSRPPESPPVSDMGEAHAVVSNTEQLTAELESKLGLKPEVKPLAEREVQPLADTISLPVVEPESQPIEEPEGKPAVKPEGRLSGVPESQPAAGNEGQLEVEPESQPVDEPEGQAGVELEGQQAVEPEGQSGLSSEVQPLAERETQPLADSVGQTKEELIGQRGPDPNVLPVVEPGSQPAVETQSEPVDEPEGQAEVELEGQQAVEPEGQSELSPEVQPLAERKIQPLADTISLPVVEPDKPERSPSPNQPIMSIKATPLNVKDGKIALNMSQLGQQLLPLNKVKSIAVAEIAHDQELPYLLIDLFLDDPKKNDRKIRTIRLLSTRFDATKLSPGIQDLQDALKVFVSVLLKLSGATAYADEDSILLDAPQSFSSIENYEKSILS